ncbi:tetratricopeptide repeat protein [Haliangium sp.]|uniref:tetratricopeptide repeat protein n=1 Tax=Haliangium sp. TaxID=2663208 RepID=UPI003D129605
MPARSPLLVRPPTAPPLTGAALVIAIAAAAVSLPARAQPVGHTPPATRLAELTTEVQALTQGIDPPDRSPEAAQERARRHLVDAQVAFGTGDYDTAAVMLYEYVDKHPDSRSYDTALYYLAQALFERRDHMAARDYFTALMPRIGPESRFYQPALERLVELSLALRDDTDVDRWLAALDRLPPERLRPSVHYVRGKYAFFRDRVEEALGHFAKVPLETDYFFQARYFMGVCYVTLGDLTNAAAVYTDLVTRPGGSDQDAWRVIELSWLALGRLYYEADRLPEAVDAYLEVDRKSDLFEDAVYELAWVFVKSRQFDKALLALELLGKKYPATSLVPSVQILEGNLRIRKAQELSFLDSDDSGAEYARALATFEATRELFAAAHADMTRVMEAHTDPQTFLAQITGRATETFEVRATLPEVAAAWLRELPEVEQVVGIERDLEEIAGDVAQSERIIERLEHALAAPSRVDVFPDLAKKRARAVEIQEELFSIRRWIATDERDFLSRVATAEERGTLAELAVEREGLARELASQPGGELPYGERVRRARRAYTALEARERELVRVVDAAAANLVAMEKYMQERAADGDLDAASEGGAELVELRTELASLREELDGLRRDTTLAKDMAGTGDEAALRGREIRTALSEALAREQGLMLRIASRAQGAGEGDDSERGERVARLLAATQEVGDQVHALERLIDDVVEFALADVRSALVEEKAHLVAIKRELGEREAESRELGGRVVGDSFDTVAERLYDVLVRADVGVVDVTWSQKEDGDQAVQRLRIEERREQRRIEDQLRDLLGEDDLGLGPIAPAAEPGDGDGDPGEEPNGGDGGDGGDSSGDAGKDDSDRPAASAPQTRAPRGGVSP